MSRNANSSCLGGCFKGCLISFTLFALLVGVFSYAVYELAWKPQWSDRIVVWVYRDYVRPKVVETLNAQNSSPQDRDEKLALLDSGVEKYRGLPAEQKRVLLKEFLVAYYYYSRHEVIPPEKIQHLYPFVQQHLREHGKNLP